VSPHFNAGPRRRLASIWDRLYFSGMPRLGQDRIEKMFADFGLASDEDRRRFVDLARVGLIDGSAEDDVQIAFVRERPASSPKTEEDAQLP